MSTPHTRSSPWKRNTIALAIGLGFASISIAQSSDGTLFGQAKAGATVTILNAETGLQRQVKVEANGAFSFAKLPPGKYRVTSSDGQTREVTVSLGSGTEVKLNVADLDRVEITGSRTRSAIDVSSVETNAVFTSEQLRALPVQRNINSVALLAPGAVKGDPGLGDGGVPSFGGASVGENGYYINGFDVTNIRNFLSYANLPFDAVEQQQLKTGGYGAEYGRSLGGVVSILTKRGTNEWKFGGAMYYEPASLRAADRAAVLNADPLTNDAQKYSTFRRADTLTNFSYNAYASGPIIKDRLFVFGLVEGRRDVEDQYRQTDSLRRVNTTPNGMLKVDWSITDDHQLEFTGIRNKKTNVYSDYKNPDTDYYATSHLGASKRSEEREGSTVSILKYTGYLTPNLTVSALLGRVKSDVRHFVGARLDGQDCPVVLDEDTNSLGCWAGVWPPDPVRDPSAPAFDTDTRRASRFDVEYTLGSHTIKAGLDNQKFSSAAGGASDYSGGMYWRYLLSADGSVNGVPGVVAPGASFVRRRISVHTGGTYDVTNKAAYIEDSWNLNRNWLLYGGLRTESFNNVNAEGQSFVKADNLLAPRLGFSWNVHGDSSLKVYGNFGRYYIPVAANTNIRMTRGEVFEQRFYTYTGRDPRTGAPLGLSGEIGTPQITGDGKLADPATVADTKLKPMNQDEFILGFQKALSKDLSVGIKATHRKVNDGMDDFCGGLPQKQWATDNGYTDFDANSTAQCFLLNPGRDVHVKLDLHGDGKLTEVTIPAKYYDLEKYTRKYDSVEFSVEKPFNGKWGVSASYTLSRSRGTAEGYVQSTLQQEDAGATQDFDFASLTKGSEGYLPNDRRHVVKVFGNYQLTDTLRLGLNAVLSSGRPISCIGYVPDTVSDFDKVDGKGGAGDYTSASSYYCINPATGKSELRNRGTMGRTPWTTQLDLQLAYQPKVAKGKLTLQVDVFNILNEQRVTRVNEVADYARADMRPNPNYMQPTNYQDGRSVLFTGRYEF